MTRSTSFGRLVLGVAVATLGAATLSAPLTAQSQESSDERAAPQFHAGQWAAQFTVASGVTGAGVLRFRSLNTAWILDGTASFSKSSEDVTNASGPDDLVYNRIGDHSSAGVSTQLGLRRYGTSHGPVRAFHGAGLAASLSRTTTVASNVITLPKAKQTRSNYRLGAFAELGASYFVTPHLALGARGVATAGYQRTDTDTETAAPGFKQSSDGVFFQLGSAQLQLTLLF